MGRPALVDEREPTNIVRRVLDRDGIEVVVERALRAQVSDVDSACILYLPEDADAFMARHPSIDLVIEAGGERRDARNPPGELFPVDHDVYRWDRRDVQVDTRAARTL